MGAYYFISASLPRLEFGEEPEIDFEELLQLLSSNLSPEDMERVSQTRRLVDFCNLAAFWRNEPFDIHGNFNRTELEEVLQRHEALPDFLFEFLDRYESEEERLAHHAELLHHFFDYMIPRHTGFLRNYLVFERDWRLVMVAYRAKQLGRDLATELQWEDPTDPIVGQLLAQRDAKELEPPEGYEELKTIFQKHGSHPHDLFVALEEYRFRRIYEMRETELFSLDLILAYMVQLMILEKGRELEAWQ